MWAQLYLIFLPVYSRLSWLWRVSSTYFCCLVIYLACPFKNGDLNCVKIRTIFFERAVVAKKVAEYIIYLLKYQFDTISTMVWHSTTRDGQRAGSCHRCGPKCTKDVNDIIVTGLNSTPFDVSRTKQLK